MEVVPRSNRKPRCGACGKPGSVYDTRDIRRFKFVPILGTQVFFIYASRRVNCRQGGVKTEQLSWACGKEQMTTAYKWFLATWARRMNWSEVASVFGTRWNRVCRSVGHAVKWGLANRETPEFTPIGVDEIAYKRGHKFLTVVYQIDSGMRRLLWVGQNREEKTHGYEPILKHSRWCLLKRPANRTSKQTRKLRELLMYNLQTMRAYLRKEDFQQFWSYRSQTRAGKATRTRSRPPILLTRRFFNR